ncbi:facilitated glucose transporter [Gordonia sp. L191]|uniref:facilitated glucose transporter n=1 Tax=Gordonia TaxID=2053 RepID=UPI001AD66BDF|nr:MULTISPECIES: facilitated glucose transporter [Gordonia]QTI67861.1 facilitated glucose transporter [Gordonia polyisoprenivorans]WHU48731.1 facilitated glucose transporter [Gordonia sp. L191]
MTRALDRFLLAMLIVDGVVVGLGSVAFCYLRFWGQPVPVVALVAGLVNAILLWLAARTTESPLRFAPLAAWVLVLLVAAFTGPGGDVVLYLGGTTVPATLMLVLFGLGIPVALIWSGRLPRPDA